MTWRREINLYFNNSYAQWKNKLRAFTSMVSRISETWIAEAYFPSNFHKTQCLADAIRNRADFCRPKRASTDNTQSGRILWLTRVDCISTPTRNSRESSVVALSRCCIPTKSPPLIPYLLRLARMASNISGVTSYTLMKAAIRSGSREMGCGFTAASRKSWTDPWPGSKNAPP